MDSERYILSFSAGGLLHRETVKLAALYLELGDLDALRNKVLAENLLQARTMSTLNRIYREVSSRLGVLSKEEIELLVGGSPQEQVYIMWIAACRQYKFIADFAVEVLRERYISMKGDIAYEDFDYFFNQKSEWHSELDAITESTRGKLRQVLFKMLREADLITTNGIINATMLSPRLLQLIRQGNPGDIMFFPIFDSDTVGAPL